jgi:hypothetical protein
LTTREREREEELTWLEDVEMGENCDALGTDLIRELMDISILFCPTQVYFFTHL